MIPSDLATQYQLDHALQPWFFLLKRAESSGIANQKRWETQVQHERGQLEASIGALIPNALIAEETLQLFDRWQTHILFGDTTAKSLIDLDFAETYWGLLQTLPNHLKWELSYVLLQLLNSWMKQPLEDPMQSHLQLLCGKIQRLLQDAPHHLVNNQKNAQKRTLKSYIYSCVGLSLIIVVSSKMPHWAAHHYPIMTSIQTTKAGHHE